MTVITDRFSFIQPKKSTNYLEHVLKANPRNIDIGFGNSNAFAKVTSIDKNVHLVVYLLYFMKELLRHELLTAADECELSKHHKLSVHIKSQRKLMTEELGRL